MSNIFSHVRTYVVTHKIITGIVLVFAIFAGYKVYAALTSTSTAPRFVLANVERGTIISTVSGSGQVSTSNSIDIKPKVGGQIISLPTKEGSAVVRGQVIARIDATIAQKSLRDAEVNLASAKLALQKIQKAADPLTLTQSQNALDRARISKQNAEDSLLKTYDDSFNSISNAFLDLPGTISGMHDLLFTTSNQLGGANVNNIDYYSSSAAVFDQRGLAYGKDTDSKYHIALEKYTKNFEDYKALDRSASTSTIEAMLTESYITALAISDAVKSANNLIQFYEDQFTQHNQKIPTLAGTQLSTLNTYMGTTNTHLTDLLAMQTSIKTDKNTINDASRSINEDEQSLAKLRLGSDPLDIASAELTVTQKQNALLDAETALADYTVRAPFDGTLSKLSVKLSDPSGSATTIATIISNQKLADLSLNEVDAAKVAVGQKSNLKFDAIDRLSISGVVASIDTVGTVAQGVVTYTVKIAFDTQDERIKSGMSVNAMIDTKVKTDVLKILSSAVKSQGNNSYVEMFDFPLPVISGKEGEISAILPRKQPIVVGITDDTTTEIVSGLKEGDQVVTKTVTSTTATKAAAPSLLGGGGRNNRF